MYTLECKYESVDEKKWIVKYKFQQANIDNSEKNSELVGFSGSGIFAVIDSELVLVGIHHGSLGQNVARGNLIGTTSDFIRKICEENNCVVPQRERRVNGNLSDRISFFEEEILTELRNDDYDKVMEVLQNILNAIQKNLKELIEIFNIWDTQKLYIVESQKTCIDSICCLPVQIC